MIKRFSIVLLIALFSSLSYAQPFGAAAVRNAVAQITHTELQALVNGGPPIQKVAQFRGGLAFPVLMTAAAISAFGTWYMQQAQGAFGTPSLDAWRNYGNGTTLPPPPDPGESPSSITFSVGSTQTHYIKATGGAGSNKLFQWSCGSFSGGVQSSYQFFITNENDAFTPYATYVRRCGTSSVAQPSLADWIRGTYTPRPGETAVPHPEAAQEMQTLLPSWLPTIDLNSPLFAPGAGIEPGSPAPTSEEYEDGCQSGSNWNGSQCVTADTQGCPAGQIRPSPGAACEPDPAAQPCQPGYSRPTPGAACQPDQQPCEPGYSRLYPGGTCQPDQQPCEQGYTRPAPGAACIPETPPAPIQTPCPGMVAGDGVLGFAIAFFPNLSALFRCMFVPTRDIASRASQVAEGAKTRFPFSVAVQLQNAFSGSIGDSSTPQALPTDAGMFTLDWGWLSPLWSLVKSLLGTFIWFSALWFIWGKLHPQAVI
jgi:hypothetical protein